MYTRKVILLWIVLFSLLACKNTRLTENEVNEIKEHLKLQRGIDKDGVPYEIKQIDIELASKVILEGLKNNGFKELTDKEFNKKAEQVFGLTSSGIPCHKVVNHDNFITIFDKTNTKNYNSELTEYDPWYHANIYLIKKGHFMMNIDILENLIKFNKDNTYEITLDSATIHRNKYVFNDDKASLEWLLSNDRMFLRNLLTDFDYDQDADINKLVLNEDYEQYTINNITGRELIGSLFFTKDCNNQLKIREGLLKYVTDHTSSTDNRFIYGIGDYACTLWYGADTGLYEEDPSKIFSPLEKAKIAAYIANIEYPIIKKYKTSDDRLWIKAVSTLYNISASYPEVITLIKQHNYFDLPNLKDIVKKTEEEAN